MSPLPCNVMRAGDELAADRDATADSGAENDAEDDAVGGCGSIGRFGQREAVGVVFDADAAAERFTEVSAEWLAIEPGGVGVLDQPRVGADRAGNANAHGRRAAEFAFRDVNQLDEGANRAVVMAGIGARDGAC